jgi:hypothetical protein
VQDQKNNPHDPAKHGGEEGDNHGEEERRQPVAMYGGEERRQPVAR